ncbi:MAG TPA: tetratricopeptide repeat protein [Myxococcaceae bacterium]|nr:tetratricopeptide repeat protein [Myxococcaceae bacterium]
MAIVDELERIRRRVEAGEALSSDEMSRLERAASGGEPVLRLAVAHALSNAGDDRAALALLEPLSRERPWDLSIHLGRARALVGLERWNEAEAELKLALALQPEDPEALKSLALLALRRGEPRRADALVADALRIDPFDAESRLVLEELRATDLPARGTAELLARLRPVLRPTAFAAKAADVVHSDRGAGVAVFYVLDDPELFRYLPNSIAARFELTAEVIDQAAWRNLESAPLAPRPATLEGGTVSLAPSPTGLWALAGGDGYDGARLLCTSQHTLLAASLGEPPYTAWLGSREYALVCRQGHAFEARLTRLVGSSEGIRGVLHLDAAGNLSAPHPERPHPGPLPGGEGD